MLLSFSWKSRSEFVHKRTLHEKEELSELIRRLGFNTEALRKWLVVIEGGQQMLAHDSGQYNAYGGFPVF